MIRNTEPAPPGRDSDAVGGPAGEGAGPPRRETETGDLLPYVVPMFAYVALGGLESYLPQIHSRPSPTWYPVAYDARVVVVAALAWWYRRTWTDLKPAPGLLGLLLAVATGLLVTGLWVGLDGLYPALPFLGHRAEFDPSGMSKGARLGFYAARMTGLVLLVPLIEELFWRSFLIRWLIAPDFRRVPIGRVTWMSALVTAALFASTHPEWLPALLTGLLWAWLLHQTRAVSACVISHAVANLALGLYVIVSGDWKYW